MKKPAGKTMNEAKSQIIININKIKKKQKELYGKKFQRMARLTSGKRMVNLKTEK